MNGKKGKALFHLVCYYYYDGETCMRYTQTYVDLTTEHIIRGVFSKNFFCGSILKMCDVTTLRYSLQSYLARIRATYRYANEEEYSFADAYYAANIQGSENLLQHY
mmetsp:Transcript_15962/g.21669  ORF Transcript_15962/g.21669 Transcript_15962/m.21669 type:complete len:106 (+) Transcript_15962:171-488(+)|eukprot:CAMPEP_0170463920 /NCGR_PEP_ID=MMETSP0123-20130129/8844_1 /TAXON_ID=182087 /ORGANISM="Favella ehrenbergii, Strain Fehren 1" /LENGTH=105 /DNA_ID=CAMNT_0010729459 /DNA_START=266 /DNA_END=583 /DNA_ORIENTATION=+